MGFGFYKKETPVSKKEYRCQLCWIAIPKGVMHVKETGTYDGDFFSDRQHVECHEEYKRQNYDNEYDEPMGFFDGYMPDWPYDIKSWCEKIRKIYLEKQEPVAQETFTLKELKTIEFALEGTYYPKGEDVEVLNKIRSMIVKLQETTYEKSQVQN